VLRTRRFARAHRLLAAGLLLLVVGLSACQIDGQVNVTVEDDGSGVVEVVVTLDQEAAERIPELADQLRAGDLKEQGWEITGPEAVEGQPGAVAVTATKPFASPEQLTAVMDEIGGADGLFPGFELTRTHTFAEVEHEITGTIDTTGGLESLSDEELTELLGGQPLGFDLAVLEQDLGAPPASLVDLSLAVTLPGDEVTASTPGEVSGRTTTWTAGFDDTEPVAVEATSSTTDSTIRILAGVAAGALLLLGLLLLFRLVRRRIRRRRERRAGPAGESASGADTA
jgi:hypothetical protein